MQKEGKRCKSMKTRRLTPHVNKRFSDNLNLLKFLTIILIYICHRGSIIAIDADNKSESL